MAGAIIVRESYEAVTRSVQRSGGEMAYVLVGALMKLGPVVRRAGPGPPNNRRSDQAMVGK
ncbi:MULTISPECIES: hypothetical protein [Bradyrhizobium]|uniref:hypothetical protein n=1 Tax=Bradyrhizobium pachyrhizi TaxID=280333 RepID=UPI0004000A93